MSYTNTLHKANSSEHLRFTSTSKYFQEFPSNCLLETTELSGKVKARGHLHVCVCVCAYMVLPDNNFSFNNHIREKL